MDLYIWDIHWDRGKSNINYVQSTMPTAAYDDHTEFIVCPIGSRGHQNRYFIGWRQVMSKKHPGFAAVTKKIAKKQGVSKEDAAAMLASSTRGASKKAKNANKRLKRVK